MVFLSASDETTMASPHRFVMGGFVAPQSEWEDYFRPAWQERVLDGPPPIPYMHVTELKSPRWQAEHGLTEHEADRRLAEAVRVLRSHGALSPISSELEWLDFDVELRDAFRRGKDMKPPAPFKQPDLMAFIAYVAITLLHLTRERLLPVTRVDFLVERKNKVTHQLEESVAAARTYLKTSKWPELSPLVGTMRRGGKEDMELQAADVFLWHLQRHYSENRSRRDSRRLFRIAEARRGHRQEWRASQFSQVRRSLKAML
jgi:hypothetical protein